MQTSEEPGAAEADPGQAKQTQEPKGASTYVVQREAAAAFAPSEDVEVGERPDASNIEFVAAGGEETDVWVDVATVELPLRSHRKNAIMEALRVSGLQPGPGERFRILDADAAQDFIVRPRKPVVDDLEVVPL